MKINIKTFHRDVLIIIQTGHRVIKRLDQHRDMLIHIKTFHREMLIIILTVHGDMLINIKTFHRDMLINTGRCADKRTWK